MRKISKTLYNRLVAQAEEAKELGFDSLSDNIFDALVESVEYEDESNDSSEEYSLYSLKEELHKDIWKMLIKVVSYYDIRSVNVESVDDQIEDLVSIVLEKLKESLNIKQAIGPKEPKTPGESD